MTNKRVMFILIMFSMVFCCIGGSLAYLSWETSEEQSTKIVFSLDEHFECAADAGGNITGGDVLLAPALCTSETNAIKRELIVSPTIFGDINVNLDLWLEINSIDDELRNTTNFRYALTTSANSCTDGVVVSGSFYGKENDSTVELLKRRLYTSTINETYYLYIWLDAAETSLETANKSFDFSLNGSCTDDPTVPDTYTYTVSYNVNGGSGYVDSQDKSPGVDITLSTEEPTREGYAFVGWNTMSDGSGVTYTSGDLYNTDASLTLYAMWGEIYTICYNANGGSGAPSCQEKIEGQTLTLSTTVPTKDGYVFSGWSESETATELEYYAGNSYIKDSDATLYAIWKEPQITYTISYDANGGSGAPDSQTKTYGETLILSSTVPTRTGYMFNGWNTAADGSGTGYQPGAAYTLEMDNTLYAVWIPNAVTISFSVNGGKLTDGTGAVVYTVENDLVYGDGTLYTTSISYGETLTNDGNGLIDYDYSPRFVISKIGYIATEGHEWICLSENCLSETYDDVTTYSASDFCNLSEESCEITLGVYWTQDTYTITYYLGNASSTAGATSIGTSNCTYESSCTLATWDSLGATFPNSTNKWTFAGWTTSTSETSVSYTDGNSFTYLTAGNIDLYAIGTRTFNYYSGIAPTSILSSQTQYWNPYSTSYATSIVVPSGTDINTWTFLGYRADANANSTVSFDTTGTQVPPVGTYTGTYFRSKYSRTATINYDANGGSGTTASTTSTQYYNSGYKGTDSKLSTPSMTLATNSFAYTGYDFNGWNTKADGTGTQYAAGATYTFSNGVSEAASVTLYAQWKIKTYIISYDACSGTGVPSSQTKTYGETLTLSSTKPTRTGYTFLGWSTESAGGCEATSATYAAGGSYTTNAAATLYAVWEINSFGSYLINNKSSISNLSTSLLGGYYRYQGTYAAVTNNYICFGTSTKSTCTGSPTKYMYRIIGFDDSGIVKIIKHNALTTTYQWNSQSGTPINWTDSTLYSGLNGSYFLSNTTYVPSGWSDKIKAVDWYYDTSTTVSGNSDSLTPANLYKFEIGTYSSVSTTVSTVSAKIGLMKRSDFMWAKGTTASCYSSSTACRSDNWLYMGNYVTLTDSDTSLSYEWMLDKRGSSGSQYAFAIHSRSSSEGGYMTTDHGIYTQARYVRPVFNLDSSVNINGGSGTSSDPYLIS